MFNLENTCGFSVDDINLLNDALDALVAQGMEASNAADIVNNNWQEDGNTVESLTRR
ncbi:MAG: hypothetical protein NW217_13360 [Hyphomicrobiaceae bacterium]|nr:hypothetical protein [Hyphomicrobiaceae bacterium]